MLRCTSKRKVFRLGRQCGKTEALVIAILHAVFTHKDFKVVVITPYQTQIELIFSRLDKLIKSTNTTANSLKRFVKAPNFTIELHNGSTIKGFTAGTKSGGNADAVRGQKANMLVFDEADYLATEDMASALALITNYPDATVWMSSTPTGKREKFYDACNSKMYKEFYYPSWLNPLWSKDLENYYRGEFNTIDYEHEIEANWGEQEAGVYQGAYVETAMQDYRYEDQKRMENWVYCMGTDWNDVKVGTTIAVIGFNPTTGIFKLVHRAVVSKDGWTQTAACQKIIELNRYWQPAYIYVDKGFGHTQDEILRKYGWDALIDKKRGKNHPDSKLAKSVKTYDFSSKITTKDLFTRQDKDKPAKPFLIENSVRRFEQHQIHFSKYDAQLEAELRGYIIDHITSTGLPVYVQGNSKVGDHNLDALNLALIAFTLELSPYGQVTSDSTIAFSGNFGEPPIQQNIYNKPQHNKPDMNRTGFVEQNKLVLNKNPGKTRGDQTKLWSWPGFERDAPRPNSRDIRGAPIGPNSRPRPPVRKKF